MDNRILIVDDEKNIAWALEESLLDDGYSVQTAHCAEDGLKLFKESLSVSPFKIVLTDMKMPGMSGIELLGKVKELSPVTQVVIITAYGNLDSAVDAIRLGALDFIQKPFQINDVKKVVARAIDLVNEKMLQPAVAANPPEEPKPIHKKQNVLEIQDRILPSGESMLGTLSIDVKSAPKSGVGADFYDYFYVNEDKVLIVIGDVGEKGIDGSLVMIMVKSLIRSEAGHSDNPVEILGRVNSHLRKQGIGGVPITVFLGIFDNKKGVFEYINAGHEKPLFFNHCDLRSANMLIGNGIFIGLFDNPDFKLSAIDCAQGDIFLFYTDGFIRVIEKKANKEEPYGILRRSAQNMLPEKRYSLAESLFREFVDNDIEPEDDITILSVCVGAGLCREKEIRCKCDKNSLVLVRSATEELLRGVQLSYGDRHSIITAVYEALINSLYFAYPDEGEGEIVVRYKFADNVIRLEIEDFGTGFELDKYIPPDNKTYDGLIKESGRGIFLMKSLMDKVSIKSVLGKGTCVILEKYFDIEKAGVKK